MRLRAVLLDMGGVLVPEPSGYDAAASDRNLLGELHARGYRDPKTTIRELAERLRDSYRALEQACTQPDLESVFSDLEPGLRDRLLDAFRRASVEPVYSGVVEIVEDLAQAYRLALVSNTVIPGDQHARSLEAAGILRHFEVALWSANFGRRKPDPAMILHVLEKLGVARHEAILVGDKVRTDVAAARRAGIAVVLLRRPETSQPGVAEPDFVIDDIAELPELLRRTTAT